jgi:hypothetical protein
MASGGEVTPGTPADRQAIQISKSTLKGLECQFYGSNTFDTFYPDPSKHKFCEDGKRSAYVLVQDLPENIFKLADRSLSGFENTDLEKFFDKHLPPEIRRPKCKVGSYEVEEQSGGGSSYKRNVVTGIAEFDSPKTAEDAVAAMNSKGPRKIMTKDDPDIEALHKVFSPASVRFALHLVTQSRQSMRRSLPSPRTAKRSSQQSKTSKKISARSSMTSTAGSAPYSMYPTASSNTDTSPKTSPKLMTS